MAGTIFAFKFRQAGCGNVQLLCGLTVCLSSNRHGSAESTVGGERLELRGVIFDRESIPISRVKRKAKIH